MLQTKTQSMTHACKNKKPGSITSSDHTNNPPWLNDRQLHAYYKRLRQRQRRKIKEGDFQYIKTPLLAGLPVVCHIQTNSPISKNVNCNELVNLCSLVYTWFRINNLTTYMGDRTLTLVVFPIYFRSPS